jgi:ERO1-like protein beta
MRKTAATNFFLAVFSLLDSVHAAGDASRKTRDNASNVCAVSSTITTSPKPEAPVATLRPKRTTYTLRSYQYEPNKIVSDACASYVNLETINDDLSSNLRSLTTDTDFFSHYRLNLYNKKCPFWTDENGMCGNIACAVNTLDNEEDIPLVWRADELGKLEGRKAQHPGRREQEARPSGRPLQGELGDDVGESCVLEYDDECDERDYCVPEDERSTSKGDYVSLVDNPERFTGYSGAGSKQVWDAIYRENCFAKPSTPSGASLIAKPPQQAKAANDLLSVMKDYSIQEGVKQAISQGDQGPIDELEFDQECVEKRVFYRVVSGMHASISTHICYEFLNQTTGQWSPNLECYKSRLHEHPERISNLYFNYALLLRAVGKLRNHLKSYVFCSADPVQNKETKSLILRLSETIRQKGNIFDENIMFQSADAVGLKDDFKNRFRNISRVMDCVGCDKCRLWGKVQTNGYGTALKILFEFDEKNPKNDPPLRRTELVALVNTLDRVSHSLTAVKYFQGLIDQAEAHSLPGGAAGNVTATDLTPRETDPPKIQEPPLLRSNNEDSVSEMFWKEVNEVWTIYKYVLKSWVTLPFKM